MGTTVDLPDLNVWLAFTCSAHSHHQHAVPYWEQQAAPQRRPHQQNPQQPKQP
jgi:hypothetical protein